jgi:hypothetical protein
VQLLRAGIKLIDLTGDILPLFSPMERSDWDFGHGCEACQSLKPDLSLNCELLFIIEKKGIYIVIRYLAVMSIQRQGRILGLDHPLSLMIRYRM